MRVLVSAASKHGATSEIATKVAKELASRGFEVVAQPADVVPSVAGFDAVVIGSAVYAGRWLAPARALVEREAATLLTLPVWLFSSGPIGDAAKPDAGRSDGAALRTLVGARDHRVFSGRLDRSELSVGERFVVRVVRAPDGDFRNWDEVRDWAAEIARELSEPVATTVHATTDATPVG